MPKVPLTFACGLTDRTFALSTGEVQPEGLDLNFLAINHPRDVFDRMVGNYEFDASELSSSEYITRYVAGDRNFVAIPVFPSRTFRHSFICVNDGAVKSPKDLEGKKIGVQLYTMTAAVWIRGVLADMGVDLSGVQWIEGAMESAKPHGKPSALPTLKKVNIRRNETGKSLSQLLEEGDIDATIGADIPPCLGKAPHVRRLFPDFKNVEKSYYKETGIFPIMHLVVLRREYYEQHRWAATSLYNALNDSKEVGRERMRFLGALQYMLPWMASELDEIRDVFGDDCWPYGVERNRKTLESLVKYLHEQGMIERTVSVDELFVPVKERFMKV
jgi:4,5-dihydroxyphthalate decarboxylase